MKITAMKKALLGVSLFWGVCGAAQAISISVNPANVICAVSVSGQAIGSKGIPATAVSIYITQNGADIPLIVNGPLDKNGNFSWSGVVPKVTSLANAKVKAVTNRQTTATAEINGSCSGQ
jgi:hypothetical protein